MTVCDNKTITFDSKERGSERERGREKEPTPARKQM